MTLLITPTLRSSLFFTYPPVGEGEGGKDWLLHVPCSPHFPYISPPLLDPPSRPMVNFDPRGVSRPSSPSGCPSLPKTVLKKCSLQVSALSSSEGSRLPGSASPHPRSGGSSSLTALSPALDGTARWGGGSLALMEGERETHTHTLGLSFILTLIRG